MKNFALGFLLSLSLFSNAYGVDPLIQEMTDLRSSLNYDDPAYHELTLRIADLYFNNSIKDDVNTADKLKAIDLYKEVLAKKGTATEQSLVTKIHFQIARLQERLKNHKVAMKFYAKVYESKTADEKLKREAALSLGEYYENEGIYDAAEKYFASGIELCTNADVCAFAHHRYGWLQYRKNNIAKAIDEVRLGLWTSRGEIREEALKDFILFLGQQSQSSGKKSLVEVEKISQKISRPILIEQLAMSYYSAGNRKAGTNVLEHVNRKNPRLFLQAKLIEEYIGFEDFDKVNKYLSDIQSQKKAKPEDNSKEAKELVKILRRVIVQLDALRKNKAELKESSKKSIALYLSIYPNDKLKEKMREGWLAVTSDENEKISQLKTWIDSETDQTTKHVKMLHHTRLAIAQKQKNKNIVREESKALMTIAKAPSEKREYRYIFAKTFYDDKNFAEALPHFIALADITSGNTVDEWAVLSQNLSLDIYNQQKDFDGLIKQTESWTKNQNILVTNKLKKELNSQRAILNQARFERAASLGESQEALNEFFKFCMNKKSEEKSCSNAKVLAVKLKDQTKLITLLEKEGDQDALASEYEFMGEFNKAAKILERKLKNKSTSLDFFKVALLYELDFDIKSRDRVLGKIAARFRKQKSIDNKVEGLFYQTLMEANLLSSKSLSIPWSLKYKLRLANFLQEEKSSPITKKIILSAQETTGNTWSRLVLQKMEKLDQQQRSVKFYGRNSERLFKRRTAKLTKFSKVAQEYLNKADSKTRVYMLNYLVKAYKNLSAEIMATPLPEGLDEETLKTVKSSLEKMAEPFNITAQKYLDLKTQEFANVTPANHKIVTQQLEQDNLYSTYFKAKEIRKKDILALKTEELTANLEVLKTKPNNMTALKNLESYYANQGWNRLSAYYQSRAQEVTTNIK